MRSFLDNFHEVSLISVIEDQNSFCCQVMPMTVGARGLVIEDGTAKPINIDFGVVSGYLVVPEIIQVGLGIKLSDGSVISEVVSSDLMKYLGFEDFSQANRHVVLRTSHQYVNVFIEIENTEDLVGIVKIWELKKGKAR